MSREVSNLLTGHALVVLRALQLDKPPKKLKAHPPSEDCVCLNCELANAVKEGRAALSLPPDDRGYKDLVEHDALLTLVCLLEQNKFKPV